MFEGLKNIIEIRLGLEIVKDHFEHSKGTFIKIDPKDLFLVVNFLKDDPDTKLNQLEQILLVPKNSIPWSKYIDEKSDELLYQISSTKLPYRIFLCIDTLHKNIPSIKSLHKCASFWQKDLSFRHNFSFEEILLLAKFDANKFL